MLPLDFSEAYTHQDHVNYVHFACMRACDVTIAGLAFGSAAVDDLTTPWNETVGWDSRADLKLDGEVNIFDLVIIGINFGAGT